MRDSRIIEIREILDKNKHGSAYAWQNSNSSDTARYVLSYIMLWELSEFFFESKLIYYSKELDNKSLLGNLPNFSESHTLRTMAHSVYTSSPIFNNYTIPKVQFIPKVIVPGYFHLYPSLDEKRDIFISSILNNELFESGLEIIFHLDGSTLEKLFK
jgi:hypothetical protein